MVKAANSSKTRRSTPRKASRCSVCEAHGGETFWFLRKQFIFDVDRAREITQDGRRPILLERNDVRYAVDSSRIKEAHVPHVDVRFPGIIARVRYVEPDGSVVTGDVLIDGHHRAARCLQIRRPFKVFLLTHDETDEVLTRRPDARRLAKARRKKSAAPRARKPKARVAKKQR